MKTLPGKRNGRKQHEAFAVESGHLRWAVDPLSFVDESACFGESPREIESDDKPDYRDDVDVSPAPRSDVGESQ